MVDHPNILCLFGVSDEVGVIPEFLELKVRDCLVGTRTEQEVEDD